MIDLGKRDVLGVLVDVVDYDAAVQRVLQASQVRKPYAATALAVHGVMTGVDDPARREILNALDLVTPDGQPVRWMLNGVHGARLRERVYGPDLMLKLCKEAARLRIGVYLYGSTPAVVAGLAASLQASICELRIAGAEPSLFRDLTPRERRELVQRIKRSDAGMVFVGLGCPRQEQFVFELREEIGIPLIAVGAAFDFLSGTKPQAPLWMQRSGLEWAFRLATEPRRLWRRYLKQNPRFAVLALAQWLRARFL